MIRTRTGAVRYTLQFAALFTEYSAEVLPPRGERPDLHYDDPATIRRTAMISFHDGSGPYRLAPGDTLSSSLRVVAAGTASDMDQITSNAYKLLGAGVRHFETPRVR